MLALIRAVPPDLPRDDIAPSSPLGCSHNIVKASGQHFCIASPLNSRPAQAAVQLQHPEATENRGHAPVSAMRGGLSVLGPFPPHPLHGARPSCAQDRVACTHGTRTCSDNAPPNANLFGFSSGDDGFTGEHDGCPTRSPQHDKLPRAKAHIRDVR